MPTAVKLSSGEVANLVELSARQMELLTTLMGVAHEKHALETENAKLKTQIDVLKIMLQSKRSVETILLDCIRGSLLEAMPAHMLLCTQAATQQLIGMTSKFDDDALAASVMAILRENHVGNLFEKMTELTNSDGESRGAPRARMARGS